MAAGDTLQVDEEPSHTVECEHPLFRVLRVRLAPGAKTRRHRRDVDAVACYFGATRLRVDSGGATTESATGPAAPIATPYSKAPQDRVVANVGSAPLHAIEVEIPHHAAATCARCDAFVTGVPHLHELDCVSRVAEALPWCCPTPRRIKTPDGARAFESVTHGAVDVYRIALAARAATPTFSCDRPRLFVWYSTTIVATRSSDGNEHVRRVTAGSYAFDDRRFHGKLENAGDAALEALVLVWAAVAPY
mmetsp:Transcript_34755/g.106769  ORF Transcript_34755/g.106769 Transcript_34755/m.106769 type:complete len:248 (-) Transcript_34755:123-866(-)